MELSNLRESGVKKAKLMSMSLQNVTPWSSRPHTKSSSVAEDGTGKRGRASKTGDQQASMKRKARRADDRDNREQSNMRLTRGNLANAVTPPVSVKNGWQSVFDLPCLDHIHELFRDLDNVSTYLIGLQTT